MNSRSILLGLFLFPILAGGQESLSLGEAISKGIQANHALILSRNNQRILENNNSLGQAGFWPEVNLSGSASRNLNNTHQEYSDGRVRDGVNAASHSFNTGLLVTWTLYNGGSVFVEKSRLTELERAGEFELKTAVQTTVAEITVAYHNLLLQEQYLDILRDNTALSGKRKALESMKKDLGTGTALSVLRSGVDLNSDSSACLVQETLILEARVRLNLLMGEDPTRLFKLSDPNQPLARFEWSTLEKEMGLNNPELGFQEQQLRIKQLDLKLSKSPAYPLISLFSGYNFSKTGTEVGIVESNQSYGPNAGVSLSYPIFNGFRNQTRVKNETISLVNAETNLDKEKKRLIGDLWTLYNTYEKQNTILLFEEQALDLASRAVDLAQERFKLGELNALDFRMIQIDYLAAGYRFLLARFESRKTETEILRLTGKLVQ